MRPQFSVISKVLAPALIIASVMFPAIVSAESGAIRSISVRGSGEILAAPDRATVTFTIRTDGQTEGEAMDEAASRTAGALGELAAQGVAPENVQSAAIRLRPHYAQSRLGVTDYAKIDSYSATTRISVDVLDINALGAIIPAVIGAGANGVDGIQFGLQDREAVLDDVRRLAVAQAMRLAALYAQASGNALGSVMRISEGETYDDVRHMGMEMAMDSSLRSSSPQYEMPIAPGEISVNSSINMTFELVDN